MDEIWMKVLLTVVGTLTATLLGWLGFQIKKYRDLIKKEEDETVKKTIQTTLSTELEPIKKDIKSLQNSEVNFSTRLQPLQEEIDHLKDDITEILADLKSKGVDLSNICEREKLLEHETRCAWRYRIRQLCHKYLERGCISGSEFAQLQEMYALYTAIGGNGQTKLLYEKTIQLEIKSDDEVWVMDHK